MSVFLSVIVSGSNELDGFQLNNQITFSHSRVLITQIKELKSKFSPAAV